MFTWKSIYRELASAMMKYRNRPSELIDLLKEMQGKGLSVISLNDRGPEGEEIDFTEIDPFTFFANFNRGITEARRI